MRSSCLAGPAILCRNEHDERARFTVAPRRMRILRSAAADDGALGGDEDEAAVVARHGLDAGVDFEPLAGPHEPRYAC